MNFYMKELIIFAGIICLANYSFAQNKVIQKAVKKCEREVAENCVRNSNGPNCSKFCEAA